MGFDNCADVVDGIFIWKNRSNKRFLEKTGIGVTQICEKKNIFGLNMQVIWNLII